MRSLYRTSARTLATCGGLTALTLLLWLPQASGWTALGGTLNLRARDVRVFDNFTDATARDNLVPEPNFPGAIGAPLALWKGVAEWASVRHGNGGGDPTQNFGLGSGGANFDAVWQGLAAGVGSPNDNTASEISGVSGGVLAFTELPIADGWRIRFYAGAAEWHDGPDDVAPVLGRKDLQGVMCHEYGHALGLGHSNMVAGLTMFPASTGSDSEKRSIESDDVLGVQALYGARSATKPRIDRYELPGGMLRLVGANFDALDNQVWFTNGAAGANGDPLIVKGVPSSASGTEILVAIPALALRGNVLVHVPGLGHASLSNAFPFDPLVLPCRAPESYGSAKLTSGGHLPIVSLVGRPHLALNDLELTVDEGLPNRSGFWFSGPSRASIPFQGGTLLVATPHTREGTFQFDFLGSVQIPVPIAPSMVGTTRCYQLWFQDPADPFGVGLSNAWEITFCP